MLDTPARKDEENIMAALKQSDRVGCIRLRAVGCQIRPPADFYA